MSIKGPQPTQTHVVYQWTPRTLSDEQVLRCLTTDPLLFVFREEAILDRNLAVIGRISADFSPNSVDAGRAEAAQILQLTIQLRPMLGQT